MTLRAEEKSRTRTQKTLADAVKRLLPKSVTRELQRFRSLNRDERWLYLMLRLPLVSRLAGPKLGRTPKSAQSLLFVCYGNIMRSPMCEALLKQEFGNECSHLTIFSAGLNAVPDRPAHPWAVTAARELGISLDHHMARLLTTEMLDRADAIFVMDYHNFAQLLSRWPDTKDKALLLGAYTSADYASSEIADPYYLGLEGTRQCYAVLRTCIRNLLQDLPAKDPTPNPRVFADR